MPDKQVQSMDATLDGLARFLAEKTREHWKETATPWLLSTVPADLKALGVDYRTVLGEQRLKAFAQERSGSEFQLVSHPTQRAKIGLIPADETYEFPEEAPSLGGASEVSVSRPSAPTTTLATLRFLQAISDLPREDLDAIVIPTRVLVKLLKRR